MKLTSLSFFECLRMDLLCFAYSSFCSRDSLSFSWSNSGRLWLSYFLLFVLDRCASSSSSDFNGSAEQGSAIHLAKLWFVSSCMWVHIVSLKKVTWPLGLRVSISICKEGWFTKISRHRKVRQQPRGQLELMGSFFLSSCCYSGVSEA